MSYFNATETRRHIAFAQAEALRNRMLVQYCALIAEEEVALEESKANKRAPAGWKAAWRQMMRLLLGKQAR